MTISINQQQPSFVLASDSPRRKMLLQLFDFPFTVDPSDVPEPFSENEPPPKIVQRLARAKATDVAGRHPNTIVLGADTIVSIDDTILVKPKNATEACSILQKLSDATHQVFTGVSLIKTDADGNIEKDILFFESTAVIFHELEDSEINLYVASGSPMDKAGAYGIQDEKAAQFVKGIKGDYYNIVGLPVHALYKQIKSFAPELLE